MKYKLVIGSHGRFEDGRNVVYRNGDPIELTSEEAAAFGDRVEPWVDDDAAVSDSDTTDQEADRPQERSAPTSARAKAPRSTRRPMKRR